MKNGEIIEQVEQLEDGLIDKSLRVLFLEDNPDDVELMQHELIEAGMKFESMRVDQKHHFISIILEFQPDIILADYSLSMFNGVQAFQMLKGTELNIPFILVTGVLNEKMALDCLNDGIDDFVLKSSFQRLPRAISNAIRKKEAEFEKKKMTLELEKSHGELRLLLNHQQVSVEEERMSIARDLHDELGQVLTALKIDVMMLWKKFSSGKLVDNKASQNEFQSIIHLVDKIAASVKEISAGLRPETLDELGLVEAIRCQAQEFERRSKIKCKVTLPSESHVFEKSLSIALFRIVQEALTNVARHSQATSVEINFVVKSQKIILQVLDNGIGIREDEIKNSKSLGLIGLRERVHQLNGEFKIGATPEGGTQVSVSIPLIEKTGL